MKVAECPTPAGDAIAEAIDLAVAGYKSVFGDRLAQVWLFGSRATGQHRPDSDVDLLVALHREGDIVAELNLLQTVATPIRLSLGVFVDGHTTTLHDLETGKDDFHHFARSEGKRVDV